MTKMKYPPISVILINYKEKEHTLRCLAHLSKQDYNGNIEVILLDNDSEDGSHEFLKEHIKKPWPKNFSINLIKSNKNTGLAGGVEYAKEFAKNNFIAVIDNDAIPNKIWLKGMADVMLADNNVAMVGCIINNSGDFYKGKFKPNDIINLLGEPVNIPTKNPHLAFKAPEGALLFRRDMFPKLYDTDYFLLGCDIYSAWLARIRGYDIKLAPNSRLEHIGGIVRKKKRTLFEFHGEKNKITNWIIVYEGKTFLKLLPLFIADIFVVLLISLFNGRILVRLKSYIWVLRNLPRILEKRKWFQSQRKLSDNEILQLVSYVTPYNFPIITPIINFLVKSYCYTVRLPVLEFSENKG